MKTKICGLKDLESTLTAIQCGADFIGFVFFPQSKRNITPGKAADICSKIGHRARRVGVFVDEEPERVNAIARLCDLDYVQLHGSEDAAYIEKMRCPVIKAFGYRPDTFSSKEINKIPAQLILVDTWRHGFSGGSGMQFSWRRAAEEIKKIKASVIIAGGLNVTNIQKAWDVFHPFGVDVSSSLEVDGKKDPEKIRAFLEAVHTLKYHRENEYVIPVEEKEPGQKPRRKHRKVEE